MSEQALGVNETDSGFPSTLEWCRDAEAKTMDLLFLVCLYYFVENFKIVGLCFFDFVLFLPLFMHA
jgi:hypothetical protein